VDIDIPDPRTYKWQSCGKLGENLAPSTWYMIKCNLSSDYTAIYGYKIKLTPSNQILQFCGIKVYGYINSGIDNEKTLERMGIGSSLSMDLSDG